jgi:hypothetical protein
MSENDEVCEEIIETLSDDLGQLPPCNTDLYEDGVCIAMYATYGSNHFNLLIEKVANESGRKVDWHYFGGRARVLTMAEDIDIVSPILDRIVPPALAKKGKELYPHLHKGD